VLGMLVQLAGNSRVYCHQLRDARSLLERLSEDDTRAARLLTSVEIALSSERMLNGTPAQIETLALQIAEELDPSTRVRRR
jgi:hypothetical protein